MNETQAAIKRVLQKRKNRGASVQAISQYKAHLLTIWKNNEDMSTFIESVDAE